MQVQRKPRRRPWFCPKCRRVDFKVDQGTASSEGLEAELKQSKRSKMVFGRVQENVTERKSVERSETAKKEEKVERSEVAKKEEKVARSEAANKEEEVERSEAAKKEEKVRLTEKEKWEATKAEWLRIANEAKKGEGSGLTQRKPTILKSLAPEDKFFERKENRQKIGNAPSNIGESSSAKLKDWDKVKEAMDKLAKLKRKEEELKNKMLKSFSTKLELKDELVSVREEMVLIMNQLW